MGLFGSKKTPEEILAEGRELYGDFNFAKALKVLDKASGTLDGEPDYLIALIYMYRLDDSMTRKHLRIVADAGLHWRCPAHSPSPTSQGHLYIFSSYKPHCRSRRVPPP